MPTLTQLRYILAVHQAGHFGNAAKACHVSQPTLSAQIQKAETELGVVIFSRSQKPVTSTERGAAIIEQAQMVVAAHERMVRVAKGTTGNVAGALSLGVIPTLAPYVLPWFLKRFADAYPLVQLSIVEATTESCIRDLKRQTLDVALLATPLMEPRLSERVLFYDPFYVYAAPGESILDEGEIDEDALVADKLWVLEDGHCVRHQTMTLCDVRESCSHLSTVRFEAGSFETLRHLIDASAGYTLVPETFARLLPKERRRKQVRAFANLTPTREVSLTFLKASWKKDLIGALGDAIDEGMPRSLKRAPPERRVLPIR